MSIFNKYLHSSYCKNTVVYTIRENHGAKMIMNKLKNYDGKTTQKIP